MKNAIITMMLMGLMLSIVRAAQPIAAEKFDTAKWHDDKLADTVRLQYLEKHVLQQMEIEPRLHAAKTLWSLSKVLRNLHYQGSALMHMGSVYYRKGQYDSVLFCDTSYLSIMQQMGNQSAVASAYNNIGITYKIKGDIPTAIQYYYKSLELKEELNDKPGVARSFNNIALIYRQQEDYGKALELFKKALEINLVLNDSAAIAKSYGHIGTNHFDVGNQHQDTARLNLSIQNTKKALAIARSIKNAELHARYLNNLGYMHFEIGEHQKAIEYYEKCLVLKRVNGFKRSIGLTLSNLGEVYLELGQYPKAIEYSQQALEMAQEISNVADIQRTAYMLYRAYEALGNYEQALDMHLLATEMNDSLRRQANTKEILTQEFKRKALKDSMQYAQKEALQSLEIEKNMLALEKQKSTVLRQRVVLFASVAVLLLLAALALSIYRAKKQADQQYKEKEVLLQEIHHRVKNNLAVIISLLQLQLRRVQDDAGKQVLEQSIGRIKTMSLIHQNLYQSENLAKTNFKKYLEELLGQIMSGFEDIAEIDYSLEGDEIQLNTDVSIPLALIAFEWVNNIYKHAFPDQKGQIEIVLKETEQQYQISIADNGIGVSKEEFMGARKSLGAKIIRSLSNQMNAVLDIVRQPAGGTRLSITIGK